MPPCAARLDAGHQQAELALVGLAGDPLAGDAAVEHDDDPVRERLDLVELDRDEQDRLAAVAQRHDLVVDELDRPDVDAAGRLADQQHLRVALHLAGDDDLLLVAAGEVGGLEVAGRRADVEALDRGAREVADRGAVEREGRALEALLALVAEAGVLPLGEGHDEAAPVPVLRHVGDARVAAVVGVGRAAEVERLAVEPAPCRWWPGGCRPAPRGARTGRCPPRRRCRGSRRPAASKLTDFSRATPLSSVSERFSTSSTTGPGFAGALLHPQQHPPPDHQLGELGRAGLGGRRASSPSRRGA